MKGALTRDELLALPAATNLPTLARAFGISEPVARELLRQGKFEAMGIRINRLGAQYRVVTADVLRVLGVSPGAGLATPELDGPPQNGENSYAERASAARG